MLQGNGCQATIVSVFSQLPEALVGLERHAEAWRRKPLLRELYHDYYERMEAWRSHVPGRDVELGAGRAEYRNHRPATWCCDLLPFNWLDFAADACRLPLADGSVANLTMIDVLHHLAYVRRFFGEVSRILPRGGRAILLEPYVSPASWPVYRFLHREPCDSQVRPLDADPDEPVCDPAQALDSNQAIPTVTFWRDRHKFEELFPELRIIHRQRLSLLLYPLSGGFESPCLIPRWAVGAVRALEDALMPAAGMLAFRCLVVLEKR